MTQYVLTTFAIDGTDPLNTCLVDHEQLSTPDHAAEEPDRAASPQCPRGA